MWLYDSTYTEVADPTNPAATYGYVNGCFYRIMDVTDSENGTSVQIEVQPPLRMPDPKNATFQARQMTLMRGVVEVFERGNLRE